MSPHPSKIYRNTHLNKEKVETEFLHLYLGFKKGGMKSKTAFQSLRNMGYTKTQLTLERNIKTLNATGHSLKLVKRNSNKTLLNDEQMEQIHSWILSRNLANAPIQLLYVKKEIYDSLHITVSIRTAGNIVKRLGHTRKTCQTKTPGFLKTTSELKEEYWNFILKMKKENRFCRPPSEIRSIDVTYTKRPTINITTFSPR